MDFALGCWIGKSVFIASSLDCDVLVLRVTVDLQEMACRDENDRL